ncbi:MAG: hypothetical protein methR_P3115 [Methyloprofundus sp.]|nr:MAG: hypothetical protein methR_P3115 [Methyloprofundus sp.]
MLVEQKIPLLEDILGQWQDLIGDEYEGYKNHVYRMVHFCLALHDCSAEEREKIITAACFHDIGIWVEKTVDYIPPSIPPALAYLEINNLQQWSTEIELMISEHHKIRAFSDERYPLVEIFRQGDLVDFSFGLFKFGLSKDDISSVLAAFPNAGFHKNLGKLAAKWFVKHPFNPAPMMKW